MTVADRHGRGTGAGGRSVHSGRIWEPSRARRGVLADREYHARVLGFDGPDAGTLSFPEYAPRRRFALTDGQLLIGRYSRSRGIEPDIDLTGPPADPGVSHAHALFVPVEGGWAVVDLGSANGTFVNAANEPIEPHVPVPLAPGDTVHVGAWTTLRVG